MPYHFKFFFITHSFDLLTYLLTYFILWFIIILISLFFNSISIYAFHIHICTHVHIHMYYMFMYVCVNTKLLALLSQGKIPSWLKYLFFFFDFENLGFLGIQQDIPEQFPVVLALLLLNACSQL